MMISVYSGPLEARSVQQNRELRDRYLERVNQGRMLPASAGTYDVSRVIEGQVIEPKTLPPLKAG